MKSQKLLYIGNNLRGSNSTATTIETLSEQLRSIGYEVVCYSSRKSKILRLLAMIYGVLKHGRSVQVVLIDTYSTQNFYYAVAVANVCRLLSVPYVPILHGGNLPERLEKSKANSYKLFKGAKTNVAPSHYLMEAFEEKGYTNLTHIPNTISLDSYSFLLRKEARPSLLWVRSFAEIYNPMLALHLIQKLSEDFPNAELCMVGPDKDGSMERCKAYAKEHQLAVTFTGKLTKDEWRKKSEDYDIFINTTNFDNMPVSVIEAMALGLPVVSTDVGGISHLITDQKDGLLVPPNQVEELYNAVKLLCANASLVGQLSENGRKKAEAFDWQNVKQHWQALLKE